MLGLEGFAWWKGDGKGIIMEEPDPEPGSLPFFTRLASPRRPALIARRGAAGTIPCLSLLVAFEPLARAL